MYCLVFLGHLAGRAPLINHAPVLRIGREAGSDLSLLENGVSDQHAVIEQREDGYYVRDLASATGVRVNGRRAGQQRLRSGDELELGAVRFRFEIIHEPTSARRAIDPLLGLAGAAVASILIGQVILVGRLLQEPRPAYLQPARSVAALTPAPTTPPPAARDRAPAPTATVAPPETPRPAPAPPLVLNRKLRVALLRLASAPTTTRLTLVVRAQVGERILDRRAVAIALHWLRRDPATGADRWEPPLWLAVPAWENFSTQEFHALFAGRPEECGGCVVHTFYRGEIQDQAATPPVLLDRAPPPPPPPAS